MVAGKDKNLPLEYVFWVASALPKIYRLEWKPLTLTYNLAYYDKELIMTMVYPKVGHLKGASFV
jgi:hypothetical protein